MNLSPFVGTSGVFFNFLPFVDTREVIVIEGLQFHDADILQRSRVLDEIAAALEADPLYWKSPSSEHEKMIARLKMKTWGTDKQKGVQIKKKCPDYKEETDLIFLEKTLKTDLKVAADRSDATYYNAKQGVRYHLTFKKHSIADLKNALETENAIVVYSGHARYGRGPCLDVYDPPYPEHGNQWEDGDDPLTDGIFRMGYPYIPVELSDLEHHRYVFRPVPVEDGPIPNEAKDPKSRHPGCRRWLEKINLPAPYAPNPDDPSDIYDASSYVVAGSVSPSGKYWGFGKQIILKGGWDGTARSTFNLNDVDMKCTTFCHFGCSTKQHCWSLVRTPEYKGWVRPDPPTARLAYFTTASSTWRCAYWLYYLLTCDLPSSTANHLFETHQYAKKRANRRLLAEGARFQIY